MTSNKTSSVFLLFLISGTLAIPALILCDFFTLGINNEWTWPRIPFSEAHLFSIFYSAFISTGIFAFLFFGAKRISHAKLIESLLWLGSLTAISSLAPFFICQSAPGIFGLQRGPLILYYSNTSGYFLESKKHLEPIDEYLKKYPDELRKGDYLHLGTHPPGLVVMYRTFNSLCQSNSWLRGLLQKSEPDEISEAMNFLATQQSPNQEKQSSLVPISGVDRHVLWLRMLVGAFLLGILPVGVYGLLKHETDPTTAWWFASLSIFIPGITCFFPKSDTLYPAFSLWVLLIIFHGVKTKSLIMRVFMITFAGILLSFGLCFSLALLPIGMVAGLWMIFDVLGNENNSTESKASSTRFTVYLKELITKNYLPFTLGVFFMPLLLWFFFHLNLLEIWKLNIKNHAAFYDHNTRSYFAWLGMNLFELTLSVGFPVILVVVYFGFCFYQQYRIIFSTPLGRLCLSIVLVWSLLWLSGKNMGEALRLWIFWTPLWIVAAGYSYNKLRNQSTKSILPVISICQILICLITASRIDSFGFTTLMGK